MRPIETISRENFSPYGTILKFNDDRPDNLFEVLVTEPEKPWRLALFRVLNRECRKLECHPVSMESFEPLKGVGILLAAEPQSPDAWHAFLLDQPVCLHKGVWHAMVTLTDETVVKITENLEVDSEFYEFPMDICAGMN